MIVKLKRRSLLVQHVFAASPKTDFSVILLWLVRIRTAKRVIKCYSVSEKKVFQQTYLKLSVNLCTLFQWQSHLDVEKNSVPQWRHLNFAGERTGSFPWWLGVFRDRELSGQHVYISLFFDVSRFRKSLFFSLYGINIITGSRSLRSFNVQND